MAIVSYGGIIAVYTCEGVTGSFYLDMFTTIVKGLQTWENRLRSGN
jgi:hypothetical protein